MACNLFIFVLVAASLASAFHGPDIETCPLAGCTGSEVNSVAASALIQQVQQQIQGQKAKVVAKEIASQAVHEDNSPASTQSSFVAKSTQQSKKRQRRLKHSSNVHAVRTRSKRAAATSGLASSTALSMLQVSAMHLGMARLASKAGPRAHTRLRGWTAPLDEAGYQAVASLKSDDDMEIFIRRTIDAYDCKIFNQTSFMSIVPWFSGTTAVQNFERLQETLLYAVLTKQGKPWLLYKNTDGTTGDNAELSFMGYVEVVASRQPDQMASFVRRVCDKLGVDIVDEDAFMKGIVTQYTGKETFQDFNRLEKDIQRAADSPKTWASWRNSGMHQT
jgi:hypothetical protein